MKEHYILRKLQKPGSASGSEREKAEEGGWGKMVKDLTWHARAVGKRSQEVLME